MFTQVSGGCVLVVGLHRLVVMSFFFSLQKPDTHTDFPTVEMEHWSVKLGPPYSVRPTAASLGGKSGRQDRL